MSNNGEKISEFLDIEHDIEEVGKELKEVKEALPVIQQELDRGNDIVDDYQYRRKQLYNLTQKGSEALEHILHVAKESDHPRAYEVVAQLLKANSDLVKELTSLQNEMNKIENDKDGGPSKVVNNNAVFVGNTNELLEMLKGKNRS
jgi:DNA-binding PadR family transcriptional regulator